MEKSFNTNPEGKMTKFFQKLRLGKIIMLIFFGSFFFQIKVVQASFNCDASFDDLNIPHLRTTSSDHFYYCFGFQHGQDRAWQMDYFRRVAQGRNAEILGYTHLKSDLMMRLLDLPSLAKKIWGNFSLEKKRYLENYANGVNEGFKSGKMSKEFRDGGYTPEDWTPEDSLTVLLLQSFDQTRKTFFTDYEEEKHKLKWSDQAQKLFDEDGLPWENTILKKGEYKVATSQVTTIRSEKRLVKLWGDFPNLFGAESGSNNWVISKSKAVNGKAILANDPHLDLKTPILWYWIHLKNQDTNVIGGSVPGVPVIVSGTNGKVAWGLTNSYLNSADAVFVNDISKDQLEVIRPLVKFKFGIFKIPFFFKSFEKLDSIFPVLPLEIENKNNHKLLLRWSGFSLTPEDIYPLFELNKVQNVIEADDLLSQIGVPSWNYVFADNKGDIGYRLVGKTYKSTKKNTLGIPVMSLNEFHQVQFLSKVEKPHVLKPARAYIYSANNRHWPKDALLYGGRSYSSSFRGYRLDELMQGQHDVESTMKIQCDTQVIDARFFKEKILKIIDSKVLSNWNIDSEDDSKALPFYRRLLDLLREKWEVNETALFRILDNISELQKDDLKKVAEQALIEIKGRSWGQMHRLKFEHVSKNPAWVFAPDIPGVGDNHTVNLGTSTWNADLGIYEQSVGASMRMIVEMGREPKIWLALPGLNREYDKAPAGPNPWENWRTCKYSEIKFSERD